MTGINDLLNMNKLIGLFNVQSMMQVILHYNGVDMPKEKNGLHAAKHNTLERFPCQ